MSDIRIIHGDCMEAMKEMGDKEYSLAIVDPPYGDGEGGAGNHEQHNHKSIMRSVADLRGIGRERERATTGLGKEEAVPFWRSL